MKKVAVIQDLSSFGKCSLTAAIPVLSVMGVQACPLPTAILSAQTEYPSFFCEDLTANMPLFIEEWDRMQESFDGIHTGFITRKEQINHIFRFLDTFYQEDTLLLVDPVMGDIGNAYTNFDDDLLTQMKELVRQADIITPNVTECCLLTGLSYDSLYRYTNEKDFLQAIQEAGQQLRQETGAHVIITGIDPPSEQKDTQMIGNMYIDDVQSIYSCSPFNGKSYSGTGDLFASVLMGSLMRGEDISQAIRLAETFLTAAIQDAYVEKTPTAAGVNFEKYLRLLL
ncbi:pyridoxamine kinase [Sporosarcina obsidiansis]|uniref:pyridoxamine kinase n=1 Tax=Sporosarcina obsidiansis TaxID=2660748 RepID=UPI00129BF729|nr:pyridoxamine kinase [Sporosarcina obsidiansis]